MNDENLENDDGNDRLLNDNPIEVGSSSDNNSDNLSDGTILSLEDYVERFTVRYREEETFKDLVHTYLDLTRIGKFKLTLGKYLAPSWYKKETDTIIHEYANKIREAIEIKKELQELQKVEQELRAGADEVIESSTVYDQVQEEFGLAKSSAEEAIGELEDEFADRRKLEEERTARRRAEIEMKTNVRRLVEKRLREHVVKSELVKVDDHGNLGFDERKIMEKLEDIMLKEVLEGISKQGQSGFLSKVINTFNGVVSHWDYLEDLDELPDVDWVQSIIVGRTKGYRVPQFPYLVSAKRKGRSRGTIDSALALDTSGSMRGVRYEVAKKMSLAYHALMRKLNPKNGTYLAHYDSQLFPVTTKELLDHRIGRGVTRTDFALEWLYDTLHNRGPCIATLVTDGEPYDGESAKATMEKCINVAKKFKSDPYIKLRIFLIDGNEYTQNLIRRMGREAGKDTKVCPVGVQDLAGEVIKDIPRAIGEMREIDLF